MWRVVAAVGFHFEMRDSVCLFVSATDRDVCVCVFFLSARPWQPCHLGGHDVVNPADPKSFAGKDDNIHEQETIFASHHTWFLTLLGMLMGVPMLGVGGCWYLWKRSAAPFHARWRRHAKRSLT